MKQNESERSEDIKTVIRERKKLTKVCQELSDAISVVEVSEIIKKMMDHEEYRDPKRNRINTLLIEVSSHLSNIAGLCDKDSRIKINAAKRALSMAMINPLSYANIEAILPFISGFDVNFNKRPFKVVGFQVGKIGFKGEKR